MDTVVARFHHLGRDLDELEDALVAAGARDARITGYTVVLTFDSDSHDEATEWARRALALRSEVCSPHAPQTRCPASRRH